MINIYLYKFELYILGIPTLLLIGLMLLSMIELNRATFRDIAIEVIAVFKNNQLLEILELYLLILMGGEVVDYQNSNRVIVYV